MYGQPHGTRGRGRDTCGPRGEPMEMGRRGAYGRTSPHGSDNGSDVLSDDGSIYVDDFDIIDSPYYTESDDEYPSHPPRRRRRGTRAFGGSGSEGLGPALGERGYGRGFGMYGHGRGGFGMARRAPGAGGSPGMRRRERDDAIYRRYGSDLSDSEGGLQGRGRAPLGRLGTPGLCRSRDGSVATSQGFDYNGEQRSNSRGQIRPLTYAQRCEMRAAMESDYGDSDGGSIASFGSDRSERYGRPQRRRPRLGGYGGGHGHSGYDGSRGHGP